MKKIISFGVLVAIFLVFDFSNAQEIHTQANAASINNEVNSTDGWEGNTINTSVFEEEYWGDFSIKIEAPNDGWYRGEYIFTTTPGEQYQIAIYAKSNSPTGPGFYWDGFDEYSSIDIGTNWTEYTTIRTASGTSGTIWVYTGVPALTGNSVYIDHISITPFNTSDAQPPTAPTLSSTGHADTTADLSWSGATDNIGVTGYKIFKDGALEATLGNVSAHQVTGLTADTAYSFTSAALDAAGNESVVSNAVSITTNSSGGGSSGGGSSVWSETSSVASYTGDVAVGIGTVPSGYKMAVDGKLITEEVKVQLSGNWPDYVFAEDYNLPSLKEIQRHIEEKGHLPNIPSAKEVEANGFALGEMNRLLLEKIEELTLHVIELKKENLKNREEAMLEIKNLKAAIQKLKR